MLLSISNRSIRPMKKLIRLDNWAPLYLFFRYLISNFSMYVHSLILNLQKKIQALLNHGHYHVTG